MRIARFRMSRRSAEVAMAAVVLLALAIGAHAAFTKRLGSGKSVAVGHADQAAKPSRLALVIANSRYPDADAPLTQQINDARALTTKLRSEGFDVDAVENASRDEMARAVARVGDKIKPGTVVLLYFGGYGVQAGRESYLIPTDAAIWTASDVRRDGISVESILAIMQDRGAQAKLAVIDASRRNPFERRFRTYSHGLAPIDAGNAIILSSASPGKVADDVEADHSVLMVQLLANLGDGHDGVASIFEKTRNAVAQISDGAQIPSVSSSLAEDTRIGRAESTSTVSAGS